MNEPITIDSEFKALIPPLSKDEFQQLKENCIRDGIQDTLKVWNGILIDGHNRYRISEEYDLNYQTEEMEFPDRDAVRRWIITNQLGRRNVNTYTRSCLALELKEAIQEKAKEKEAERKTTYQKSEKSNLPKIDTTKELAKLANTSHDTINKVEYLESHADDATKERLRTGEQSINSAYVEAKSRERKKAAIGAAAALEEAKERHEEFKAAKTVSIDEALQDKEDRKEIAESEYRRIKNAIKDLNFWASAISNGDMDFSAMKCALKDLSKEKKENLAERITKAIDILSRMKQAIRG